MGLSPLEELALRDPGASVDDLLAQLPEDELDAVWADWQTHARPEQLAPVGSWRWWFVRAGRGFGKTRTGAEWTADRASEFAFAAATRSRINDTPHLCGLMNATYDDVRALQVEGESGLEEVCKRRGFGLEMPTTGLHGKLLVPTDAGTHVTDLQVHTADKPDRVRGRNFGSVWMDEMAKWPQKVDNQGGTAFTNADLGLRALCPPGLSPQGIITSTPKVIALVREVLAGKYGPTVITAGSLFDNASNLAPEFISAILNHYANTRLGPQEIHGLLMEDVEGALWSEQLLERYRWLHPLPPFHEVVVGVDPPGETAECGIVVEGAAHVEWYDPVTRSTSTRLAVWTLDDLSHPGPPERWGATVVRAVRRWGAQRVVAEVNNGGDMVRATVHAADPTILVDKVRASRGKQTRAEPISLATAQGRVHLAGYFPDLETQLTTWVPGEDSPDRLDAFVWAATALGIGVEGAPGRVVTPSQAAAARAGTTATPRGTTAARGRLGGRR